ncbi:fumarylacetoacetate hydrolase family protein [Pseudonocardia thermophila]|uniref:fumarylacetoacetate hydrolase family protein n=1 Tax=Pseudonocardia thermophila TaxID=1848 RepID=UPI0009359B21|nr:fumarylacetoacetate hydrolase family protein [Pseudonocardia thermophila]
MPAPRVLVCAGLNHRDSQRELGTPDRVEPLLFLKPVSSVIGSGAPIVCPAGIAALDVSAELAVVIGRPTRGVAPEAAMAHVAGFTCANDIAVREWMRTEEQWFAAKGADGFCPLGPRIVALDDLEDRLITLRINGEVRRSGAVGDLIWGVPELLALATRHVTLGPGDVLLTGSPAAPATARPGDHVEVVVDGIGTLSNSVVRAGEEP